MGGVGGWDGIVFKIGACKIIVSSLDAPACCCHGNGRDANAGTRRNIPGLHHCLMRTRKAGDSKTQQPTHQVRSRVIYTGAVLRLLRTGSAR